MKNEKKYQKNLNWNMLIEDGKLFVTKGADEIYYIAEVDSEKVQLVFDAYQNNNIDEIYIEKNGLKAIIKELETAGVIYKSKNHIGSPNNLTVYFKWFGNEHNKIQSLLRQFISQPKNIFISDDIKSADLLLIIRSSGKMGDLMEAYEKIDKPHIFIDLAYNHTISIGPLIFPGETACLGCFAGRITRNWGDALPPEIPSASDSYELIASLILECIKTYQKFGSCPELINQAWSFNLNDFTSKYDKIFRLPWCPNCFPEKSLEGTGSFELPWRINVVVKD